MSLITELKRRNVFKVAVAYGVVSWLLIQVVDTLAPVMQLPEWTLGLVTVMLAVGFPIAILFSWAFELTPDGVKRAKDVDLEESITQNTGQKINYIIIAALVLIISGMLVERFMFGGGEGRESDEMPSIAVLAFENISNDKNQDYFADGISEEILNLLAKTDAMKVAGRTSSFSFKGKAADIPTIARELNVNHVLEGSIRKSGNKLRITAQLIRDDGYHMWSETYDREITDIFEIQDEISAAIMDELSVRLLGEAPKAATDNTNSISALEYFLKGRNLLHNDSSFEGLAASRAELEKALELDPDFVKAQLMLMHAKLRQLDTGSIFENPTLEELLEEIEAFNNDHPMDVDGWILHGRHSRHQSFVKRNQGGEFTPEDGLPFMEKAKALGANSSDFYILYGQILYSVGQKNKDQAQMEAGIQNAKLGLQLEPLSALAHRNVADLLSAMDRNKEAMEYIERGLELSPNDPELWAQRASVAGSLNMGVLKQLEYSIKASNASPNDAELIDDIVRAYITIRDFERAKRWSDKSLVLSPNYMSSIAWSAFIEIGQENYLDGYITLKEALENPETIYRKVRANQATFVMNALANTVLNPNTELEKLLEEYPILATYTFEEHGLDIDLGTDRFAVIQKAYSLYYRTGQMDQLKRFITGEEAGLARLMRQDEPDEMRVRDSKLRIAFIKGDLEEAANLLNEAHQEQRALRNNIFTRFQPMNIIILEFMQDNYISFVADTWATELRAEWDEMGIDP